MFRPISRRTVLRGIGTALALPWLEAMAPLRAGAGDSRPPRRMAFVYVPNGVHMPDFTPAAVGPNYELPYLLEPLAPFKNDILILSGLTLDKARPNGDGPGDHARAMAAFLTGRQPRKTAGADIRAGISVDQLAAQKIGDQTNLPSLEIGCDRGLQSGNCDSGYSCAYSANLSWRTESTPVPKEVDPRLVFERLFSNERRGELAESRARRDRYRQSILDLVADDAARLKARLGATDQRKMDEYLTSIRELELRIQRAAAGSVKEPPKPDMAPPTGIPKDYQEHIRLLTDLLVLAFQADLTRICTFVYANDGSNRSYPFIGVSEGHHDLSHHGGSKAKHEKLKKINRFHLTQFAYLLDKLKAIREGDSTLLDQCMIVYGSGIGDGNRHNHDDLPILLAGKGGGSIRPGRHLRYPKETPLMNLYLSMLDRLDIHVDSFGDSTGRLPGLDG
ncbi:MAG: DUF1552 domain-containing protein [Gemmataceae bacterium]|nr:DUF1552 domain-containing protein [Gemmataceae bacterium]MDW8265173.1 DUF1552 domain-containing protein [Gemmataceae bacterium]